MFAVFEGAAADVRWMAGELQGEWRATDVRCDVDLDCGNEARPNSGYHTVHWLAGFDADARIALLPSKTMGCVASLRERYCDCSMLAHAGNGIVLVKQAQGMEVSGEYYRQLRRLAESFGGKMTVLAYPENIELSREDIWGPPPDGFAVMKAIKERFDPRNVLNPGRFIFE
jgi:FAD/FMN-containing dehydrogenase